MKIVAGIVAFNTPVHCLQRLTCDLAGEPSLEIVILCNNPDKIYRDSLSILEGTAVLRFSENNGFGSGHNQIFAMTKPDWYVCCNPDVVYRAGVILGLVEAVKEIRKPGLISPLVWDPKSQRELPIRPYLSLKEFLFKNIFNTEIAKGPEIVPGVFQIEFTSGCFFIVKGSVFREVGGFDESFFLYCEDADLSLRIGKKYQNVQVPSFVVEHDGNRASRRSIRMAFNHLASLIRYVSKHQKYF